MLRLGRRFGFGKRSGDRERGDTIVEVLISLTVVSMVLGGAYVTTNKSLVATRSAQEHASALKLAETQVEQLKGLVATNPSAVFTAASPFCIYNQTTIVAANNANCVQDAGGAPTTNEPAFHLSIARSGNDFTIQDTWTDVSGNTTDSLQISYRIYQ